MISSQVVISCSTQEEADRVIEAARILATGYLSAAERCHR